jgi:pyruvate kinase
MLSAESASGHHPAEAVQMMDCIIREVEEDPDYQVAIEPSSGPADYAGCHLLCAATHDRPAACRGSGNLYDLRLYEPASGARERPAAPILSLSADPVVARRMALVWGVHSVLIDNPADVEEITAQARRAARAEDFAKPGDIIAITAGTPFGISGNTNLLKLAVV